MTGLFFSVLVFLTVWIFGSSSAVHALSSAGTFFLFWTAFWGLMLASVAGFLLVVGSSILLRLPPSVRALFAPLALKGGLKALISKPVLAWMASVVLFLAGGFQLKVAKGGVDPLVGLWLIGLGVFFRRSVWGALKSKAQFRVWRPGEFPGVDPTGAGGFESAWRDPSGAEESRFNRAQDVVIEPVTRIEDARARKRERGEPEDIS